MPQRLDHRKTAQANAAIWEQKPLLRKIYGAFHQLIAKELAEPHKAPVVELGSGIGRIRETIPGCLRSDLFRHPDLDIVQNAYALALARETVSNVVLFDVFHHLRHPGSVLDECRRVLLPRGRVIIFEPAISALGWLVYGPLHQEDIGWRKQIQWRRPDPPDCAGQNGGYAAQGNATRIFVRKEIPDALAGWRVIKTERFSALSYVASGGFTGPQLYPTAALGLMRAIDRVLDRLPRLFGTRLLVVLEKPGTS